MQMTQLLVTRQVCNRLYVNGKIIMKTQSAKAKGRKLQQWMRTLLIEKLEIHPEDIESRSMGAGGEDLIMQNLLEKSFHYQSNVKIKKK